MLKNKSKIVVLLMAILIVFTTFSYATETPDTTSADVSNTVTESEVTNTPTTIDQEIHNGDLYLFDNNIVMDKLVDGNVFLFGSNIEVTGKVNGSLYAFGNEITFGEESYIVQSIYVFGNKVQLNGSANDLYAFASEVNMAYDSFMIRDLKVFANTFNFNGGVGRNAFVDCNNFNFVTTEQKAAIVYGNLEYTSLKELSISNDFVQGDIKYTAQSVPAKETMSEIIIEHVVDFCNTLLYTFIVFLLCLWLAPKFLKKASTYMTAKNGFSCLGIGILACIATVIIIFTLLFTIVGLPLAFMLFAILVLLLSITMSITCICITYKLKEKFNYSKNYMTYITLAAVILAIWALKMVPYIGWIISLVVTFFGFGVILHYLFTKERNSKEDKKVEKVEKKEIPAKEPVKENKPVKEEKKTAPKKETQKKPKKEDK